MLKILTFSQNSDELAPMLGLIRFLYYSRAVEGFSVIAGDGEWNLDANPFIHRRYREYALSEPREPSLDWFLAAARRALLEERPGAVIVPADQSPYPEILQLARELGIASLLWPYREVDGSWSEAIRRLAPDAVGGLDSSEALWLENLATYPEVLGWLQALPEVRIVRVVARVESRGGELGRCEDPAARLVELLRDGCTRLVEPVNLRWPDTRATFRYKDYDNEFRLGPADYDLHELCRMHLPEGSFRARILDPASGSAEPVQQPTDLECPTGCPSLLELTLNPGPSGPWWERYRLDGRKRMKIVYADPKNVAGSVMNFSTTTNRCSDHEAIALCVERHPFINYPPEQCKVHYLDNQPAPELLRFLEQADAFVFFDDEDETSPAWPFDLRPYVNGKRVVHLYVGWKVHDHVERCQRPDRCILTPLPHILRMVPRAHFYAGFPPVTLDDVQMRPPRSASDGVVRILQTPSLPHRILSRFISHKDTEAYLAATRLLMERYPKLECWQLGGVSHSRVLQARLDCDITFNHLRGHVSLAGDEALYLERVLVHAFDQFSINRHREFWGMEVDFPWISTDAGALPEVLGKLVESPQRRLELGQAARPFMLEYFSPAVGLLPLLWHLDRAPVVRC